MTKDNKNKILAFAYRRVPEHWQKYSLPERLKHLQGNLPGSNMRKSICAVEVWCECFMKKQEAFTPMYAREINKVLRNLEGFTEQSSCDCGPYGRQRGFVYHGYLDELIDNLLETN